MHVDWQDQESACYLFIFTIHLSFLFFGSSAIAFLFRLSQEGSQFCRFCLCSSIVDRMARFLLPLATEQISGYFEVGSLVDVSVHTSAGTTDIVTFDPMLLPSHLSDKFLTQLFEWAKEENVLPLSSFGTWEGQCLGSHTLDLLPLYYAWLDKHARERQFLE